MKNKQVEKHLKKKAITDFIAHNPQICLKNLVEKFGKSAKSIVYELGGLKEIKKDFFEQPKTEKSSQYKAWDTRRKYALVKDYQDAKTSGVKAGIAKNFKDAFGEPIHSFIQKGKSAEKKPKKLNFEQKPIELTTPYHVQVLKEQVKLLTERIEKLERSK